MSEPMDPCLVWLMMHDRHPSSVEAVAGASRDGAVPINSSPVVDAIRTLEPAMMAAGGIASVNASSVIVGAGAAEALALDRLVVAARQAGFDAVVAAFRASPLTGCTSVMDLSLSESGWNPLDPRQADNHEGFARYVARLVATPFFQGDPTPVKTPLNLLQYPDPQTMVRAIAALVPGVTERDQRRMSSSILDMTHNVFPTGGGDVSNRGLATLFAQHALGVDGGRIDVNLYWCQAMMMYEKRSSKTSVSIAQQSVFTVERISFMFRTADWPKYAEAVARRKMTDVETWLSQTSTP